MRKLETEVLVVGGGAAGMCAALAAAEAGSRVMLLARSGGNCTALSLGNFAAVMPDVDDDTTLQHYEDTLLSGQGLSDPHLVRVLVERAGRALRRLMDWGADFETSEDGTLRRFHSSGHTGDRIYRASCGTAAQFYRVLLGRMRALGVQVHTDVDVVELLRGGTAVSGVTGVDERGQPLRIGARAVVLATGGYAGAFASSTNPPVANGAGCEMAYRVGCTLTGLEFVQFMPTTLRLPGARRALVISDLARNLGGFLRNGQGNAFSGLNVVPPLSRVTRDALAITLAQEVAEGRGTPGGGVYLDLREMKPADREIALGCLRRLRLHGQDPANDLLEVMPAAHFACGGVRIDKECSTDLAGLFAAGEVTGGVHGANRLGANALTEALVFGEVAGVSAARYAAGAPAAAKEAPSELDRMLCDSRTGRDDDDSLEIMERDIRRILWEALGVIRNGRGLRSAIYHLRAIREALESQPCHARTLKGNLYRHRLLLLASLGYKVACAAYRRQESRGAHYRTDYPSPRGVPRFISVSQAQGWKMYCG